jgi:hypothetical protein
MAAINHAYPFSTKRGKDGLSAINEVVRFFPAKRQPGSEQEIHPNDSQERGNK